MYEVIYKKSAVKTMRKIPQGIRVKLVSILRAIAVDPEAYKGDWKALKGSSYWRLRVGDYRAICDVRDEERVILVLKTGPRGGIYK